MAKFSLNSTVTLEKLTPGHAPAMLRWVSDTDIAENIGLRSAPTLEKTQAWISNTDSDRTVRAYAIVRAGVHVGNVVLDRIDDYLQTARFSIYLGDASARGTGTGLTATYLALKKGFTELNLHKIWLTVHTENHAAIKSYIQAGFNLEGVHRDEFLYQGRRLPALYMGMLAHEFKAIEIQK